MTCRASGTFRRPSCRAATTSSVPATSAWDLHRVWPEADFRMVPDAGHSAFEPGNIHELVLGDGSIPKPLMPSSGIRMRSMHCAACLVVVLLLRRVAADAATRLLRFPDVWHDGSCSAMRAICGRSSTQGGTAVRLTSHPGLELFGKFSPDGRADRVHGPVRRRRAGVRHAVRRRGAAAAHLLSRTRSVGRSLGLRQSGLRVDAGRHRDFVPLGARRLHTDGLEAVHGARERRRGDAACRCRSRAPDIFLPTASGSSTRRCGAIFAAKSAIRAAGRTICIFSISAHPALVQVTNDPRTDRDPMWIGDAIYFNSDRTGVFNLYRYDVATRQTRQITHYTDWDVRWPSADADGQIVYELDGELHLYDTRSDQDRALVDRGTDRRHHLPSAIGERGRQYRKPRHQPRRRAPRDRGPRRCLLRAGGARRHPQSHPFLQCPRSRGGLVHRRQAPGLRIGSQRRGGTLRSGAGRQRCRDARDVRLRERATTRRAGRRTTSGSPWPIRPDAST